MANRRGKWKMWQIFFSWVKIMADGNSSYEIKRHLDLGRKVMTNLHSVLKSRDMSLTTKVCIDKAMFFSVVVWMCVLDFKNVEHWGIDAFKSWCWRRLLRAPWTSRRWNQWIRKKISPEYSLQRLMLKFPYFGHVVPSQLTGNDPNAVKEWRQKEKGVVEDKMAR